MLLFIYIKSLKRLVGNNKSYLYLIIVFAFNNKKKQIKIKKNIF